MFVSAILAAGGRGARLGAGTPKQLLTLGDRTILQRSFETLASHHGVDEIVVALPADLAAAPPQFLASRAKPVRVVNGAARPFASAALFTSVIEAADASGAAIAAVPASDTVKEADEHDGLLHIVRTLPRERIYLAQTPQAFQRQILADAIAAGAGASHSRHATDEATLAEEIGHRVRLVEGERWNM